MYKLATTLILVLALAPLLVACGGNKHEDAMETFVGLIEEMNGVLAGIKDSETAASASSKLKALGEKFQAAKAVMEKLPEPAESVAKEMEKKWGGRLQSGMMALAGHGQRLAANPKVAAQLADAFKALDFD